MNKVITGRIWRMNFVSILHICQFYFRKICRSETLQCAHSYCSLFAYLDHPISSSHLKNLFIEREIQLISLKLTFNVTVWYSIQISFFKFIVEIFFRHLTTCIQLNSLINVEVTLVHQIMGNLKAIKNNARIQ
jgi:hypothetical protein